MVAMSVSLACSPHCSSFCAPTPSPILVANNLQITSLSSTCANIRIAGSDVVGDLLEESKTCHVDVVLSNGDDFAFDVPFTNRFKQCCCGSCVEGFEATWQAVDASAPPPLPDASPFPLIDASDASADVTDD